LKKKEKKSEDKETIKVKDREKVEEEDLEEKEINNNQLNKLKSQLKPQQLDFFVQLSHYKFYIISNN